MKTKHLGLAGLLVAGALACALVLAGCDNGTDPGGGGGDGPGGGGGDTPKTVAAEYRFTNPNSGFTLGETTAVNTSSVGDLTPFTLDGVYTEGGGTWTVSGGGGTWVYLYNATGKRGIVRKFTSGTDTGLIVVNLGATNVEALNMSYTFIPSLSTDGMSANPVGFFSSP